ncbi:hypothetical protein A9995_04905 [Erythrobacter sp. QSSC1-22B]|nr:hypothetical protein A9995_04905 [Erythrobacter sp. QSSC1-22B]
MKLVLITADPRLASLSERAGVGRIMVDIERMGKFERQKCRDTWISKHELSDVRPVANVLTSADLMVRINPIHEGSQGEIDVAIEGGAQSIMLPMFTDPSEVESIGRMINSRCGFIPLIETGAALDAIDEIASQSTVTEVFIGLNDLHLSLGLEFMFEPLVNGMLEKACEILSRTNKPYGFGGIARVGEGDLDAELIMQRHAHLGSTRVNLSRTFARSEMAGVADGDDTAIGSEVARLLSVYEEAKHDDALERMRIHALIEDQLANIIARLPNIA